MEAMILAAGRGTRLKPHTDTKPKALIEVAGQTMLDRVIDRIRGAGIKKIVVNTHHFEEKIREHIRQIEVGNTEIIVSPEPDGPYETGGGLFAAESLFRKDQPILLHNVDVISDIPLKHLLDQHLHARAKSKNKLIASLAVRSHGTTRKLVFDDSGLLGWESSDNPGSEGHYVREPSGAQFRWSFTGLHVLEPAIFDLSNRTGKFSIITLYLELISQGFQIAPVDVSESQWFDIGTPERLENAECRLQNSELSGA